MWLSSYQVEGVTLDFRYALTEGPIQNVTAGACYDYIQHAIDASAPGDVIVIPPGTYTEKIRLKGKSITLTSTDPEDPAVVAATVLTGPGQRVMFADDETADCLFTGFTVTGGSYGLLCSGAAPTIANCTVADNRGVGVDAVLANIANSILYFNGQDAEGVNLTVQKAASAVTYSDVQGGWTGEGNLDVDPLFVAPGDYHLKSQGWSWSTLLGTWAWDEATSPASTQAIRLRRSARSRPVRKGTR